MPENPHLQIQRLVEWLVEVLSRAGVASNDARLIAENLAGAEARGVKSHGLMLLPIYIKRIRMGGIKTDYSVKVVKDTGPVLLLDGDGGPGQALAATAMSLAIERARRFGVSFVSLRNSNHAGMLATYGLQAVRSQLIGVILTNTSPAVSVTHGLGKRTGSNALCVAAPAEPEPLVVDMSSSTVAAGKIQYAAMHGLQIPSGWVLDRDGNPSDDPADLSNGGSLTPLGGYKGYALGVMIDVLTALLAGGKPSVELTSQLSEPSRPTGVSQALAAIDPELFIGRDNLKRAVGDYAETLRQTVPGLASTPVMAPGDPEMLAGRKAEIEGVELTPQIRRVMDDVALSVGADFLTLK